ESLLRLDRGCGNGFVEPVVDLSFVDVNRRVRKNLRVPIHQAPRMVRMDVSDEDVGNALRGGPRRAEGLRDFPSRRADQFGCASVNQEKFVLVLDQKGVDGSVHRRLFEMPRQETFNLARLGVLNQFLSQSETYGSIRDGNYIDLSDLCSVNARLTTVKPRHGRERYDRLVRGLLRIRDAADDEQSRRHDLRRQQLKPRRCSRSLVDVENRGDLGMRQLDPQCMDDVAPKQDFLSRGRKFIAGMSRGMTRQRDELHPVDDWLGAAKRVPLTGLEVRRRDGLRTLEERLRILRRLSSDFWRQPKVAFGLRDVNIGIWKDPLSILSAQSADVIGMEVRNQNDVDFFRRVACAAEAARQAPECSPTPPGAGTRIDEDYLLAGVDQEARINDIQHVRIFVQRLYNTIH